MNEELINEGGFLDRSDSGFVKNVKGVLKSISSLGMRYDDQVIKQSRAVGTTEAMFAVNGPIPEDIAVALSLSDIGTRKAIAFFDKEYKDRRGFLRKFAMNGEIEFILDTIADETIVYNDKNQYCQLDTSGLRSILSEEKNKEMIDEIESYFNKIYVHFHFNDDVSAWQYFRQFLIDGYLAFEIIYDKEAKNIIGFKELDPASLRPIVKKEGDVWKKFWVQYEENPSLKRELADSQLIYISYSKNAFAGRASYTERLVRSFNLLRIMENTRIIWNLMNATYRLKMVVPIGNKSPQKAKESLAELRAIYKEDIYLDFDSGELLINGKPSMQFYKNYLMPSKEGEKPEIETVGAEGPDLSDTSILQYFHDRLKVDSKIPFSRFDRSQNGGTIVFTAEGIDREEIRFFKFINRLRSIYQEIILKPLWIQICLKYPDLEKDELFRSNLAISYHKDNLFEKMKEQEIILKVMDLIERLKGYTKDDGSSPYFSSRWLIEKYLNFDKADRTNNEDYMKKDQAAQGDANNDSPF